ncbi:hypothetical protein KAFR_0C03210 [Kazachstania africana CBS 2517]|uniref:Proteasome activator BLM10 n=1 Tax=Kazachstania africana (strain ATCC 22294 / BCRC 22015 / CBS 2517 / CECT 1963 / NBRC 1671 / NRRL Y-8276) TaxID=1071382 RepID=H2ASG3_KAZAF|nr:hypothetical protein KAFR_0C03210 [Kazachstania africana CBS 2517]CCF57313.1 hypothetical protein KAFR_0C03210 [Kazachstania africana CBS 2517]
MSGEEIKAPIPIKNKALFQLQLQERQTRGLENPKRARTPVIARSEYNYFDRSRAKSSTPTLPLGVTPVDVGGGERRLQDRLKYYGLDFPESKEEFSRKFYDQSSVWFGRKKKPEFSAEEYLPYKTESHKEQAKYLCHVLVNLYIAISSLDIQGSISISSKDLTRLKKEVDTLALETDLFRISQAKPEENFSDMGDDSENELYNEDDYINASAPDINATGKITAKSATVINVNHWTNELKNCLLFDFPLSLRKSLATVYYYLALVQGQAISRDLHVEVFEILVDDDDEGTDYTQLLRESGLVLDHKILFNFLLAFLPYPDSEHNRFDLSSKEDLQLFRTLLKLAYFAKPFYEQSEELLSSTMGILLSNFSPSTMNIVLPIITSFVPCQYHPNSKISDYFPFCFSLWTSVSATVAVDTHLYEFVGDIAEDIYINFQSKGDNFLTDSGISFGPYGVFSEDQMTFMFNRLQGHLRTNGQIHSYARTVKPFIYNIHGSDNEGFFGKLKSLLKSIETFVHPSNSGSWTKPIAKFIHSFIKTYHARAVKDKDIPWDKDTQRLRLNAECHSKIVDLFLNLLLIGAQSKDQDVTNYYISCFAYLVDLSPRNSSLIFDKVLEDLYDMFSGEFIESRHRITSSLKQFTRVVRFMVEDKAYRIHIVNILSALVSKIDMNDISLTNNILNAIVSIVSFVPLEDFVKQGEFLTFHSHTLPLAEQYYYCLKDGSLSNFAYDDKTLDDAFRASTSGFKNILTLYIDKLFQLVDIELDDSLSIKLNQTTMLMIESMSDDVFKHFSDMFQKKFWDNEAFKEKEPNYEIITIPLAAIVKRNVKLSEQLVDLLLLNCREQIERGAGSVRSFSEIHQRDVKLVLYLTALNDILRHSNVAIISFHAELIQFLKYLFKAISNPPLNVITSILVHNILASLTSTEIIEQRMFSDSMKVNVEDRWGGLQFDKRKFSEESLAFRWHIPSETEVSLAIQIFDEVVAYCIDEVNKLISHPQSSTEFTDELQKYILVLTHGLSGCSLLFDPDFNKSINGNKTVTSPSYRERLVLLKNLRERNCDNQEYDIDIEQITSRAEDEDYMDSNNTGSLEHMQGDEIAVHDDYTENLPDIDSSVSEVPSAVGTPIPGHTGPNSFMNSSVVFRDLDIYTCNYYFGATVEERMSNLQYFEVHKIRSKIGLFFHKLFKFFSSEFSTNSKIFQILLHGLKVWFVDVGQETIFSEDNGAFIDLDFIENIQSLAHLNDSFTRTYLAAKVNNAHQNRVLLHSTNRYPSKLEIQLLKDIILMATSIYPGINQVGQATLSHCMKQLIGSYSIIIRQLIKLLQDSLTAESYTQLEVLLKCLSMKKLHRKLISDFKNVEEMTRLLLDCCHVRELDISMHAHNILADLFSKIQIPTRICVYDERMFLPLAPPDCNIHLQVEAVKQAKDNRREEYIDVLIGLQKNLVERLRGDELNWRTRLLIIKLIGRLQSNLEFPSNEDAISVIVEQARTNHPTIIHFIIKVLLSIFNKVLSLSYYSYDVSKSYDNLFDPEYIIKLKSTSAEFQQEFRSEMNNILDPKYFIDSKAFAGWLCWGNDLKVVKTGQAHLALQNNEINLLTLIGKLLTKGWLSNIVSTLIKDNEAKGSFSSSEVSFFAFLTIISSQGYSEFTVKEICSMCRHYYDVTEKASIIMSVQIVAALIVASRFLDTKETEIRDLFLQSFMSECLNGDLNQDAADTWSTLFWWLPTIIDVRRCPPFIEIISNISNQSDLKSDSVNHQASRLLMLRNLSVSQDFRTYHPMEIAEHLIFDHPYDQMRDATAKLFNILVQTESYLSVETPEELLLSLSRESDLGNILKRVAPYLDEIIRTNFSVIAEEYVKIDGMSPQIVLKSRYYYLSSTMFYWITQMSKGSNRVVLIPYLVEYILPFLANFTNQRDLCQLAGIHPAKIYLGLSYLPIRKEYFKPLLAYLTAETSNVSSYEIKMQLSFIEFFLSSNLLQFGKGEVKKIINYVLVQLYNTAYVEVRMRAALVLSDLAHNFAEEIDLSNLVSRFEKSLNQYTWAEKQKRSKTDVTLHASALGLGALVSAFPYVFPLPKWIPQRLSTLSSWARTNGMVGTAAKDTISNFKKVRSDTWKFDRQLFTNDELEDLEGVLWRSYYA